MTSGEVMSSLSAPWTEKSRRQKGDGLDQAQDQDFDWARPESGGALDVGLLAGGVGLVLGAATRPLGEIALDHFQRL